MRVATTFEYSGESATDKSQLRSDLQREDFEQRGIQPSEFFASKPNWRFGCHGRCREKKKKKNRQSGRSYSTF